MIPEDLKSNPALQTLDGVASAAKFEFRELTIEVAPENVIEALTRLKRDLKFERLTSVTAVDRYPAEPRFEVVYHLQSVSRKERLRLKARVSGETPQIPTASGVYRSADWYERETFDLFGIQFIGHPDLRRIMMPEDWVGHPLRKDYPITGERY